MSATLLSHATPVARKGHRCSCCSYEIAKGTQHIRQVIVDDRIETLRMHGHCYKLLMDYMQYHAYDGDEGMPDWGEVLGWQREMKEAVV